MPDTLLFYDCARYKRKLHSGARQFLVLAKLKYSTSGCYIEGKGRTLQALLELPIPAIKKIPQSSALRAAKATFSPSSNRTFPERRED
jgi:hypothetical protein